MVDKACIVAGAGEMADKACIVVGAGEMGNKACIVVGAGELTTDLPVPQDGDLVLAVDGGLSYCIDRNLEADVLIGDMDSLFKWNGGNESTPSEVEDSKKSIKTIYLSPEKDDTDMLAALKYGLEKGYRNFHLYAASGGRLDHTIANIQCLLYLKNRGAFGYMYDAKTKIFLLQNEEICFPPDTVGRISLFAMGEEAKGVTLKGLKYPLSEYLLKNDYPLGISNEFIARKASIKVEKGTLLCIMECQ